MALLTMKIRLSILLWKYSSDRFAARLSALRSVLYLSSSCFCDKPCGLAGFFPISPWNVKSTKVCFFPSVSKRNRPFSQGCLHARYGEDTTKEFSFAAGLREVGVISNQANGICALDRVAPHSNTAQEPSVDAVHYLSPVDVLVGEEPVEHVFLAGEHLTKNASGEVETVF